MATLADSFLHDLADLEDEGDADADIAEASESGGITNGAHIENSEATEDEDDTDEIPDAIALYEKAQIETVAVVSDLSMQPEFIELMAKIRSSVEQEPMMDTEDTSSKAKLLHQSELSLIEESNHLIAKLDIEILNIHSFVRDIYSKKFPELESIVASPLEYIAVVQRIKNETDLTTIELADILPNTVTMAVTVAGSMTTGHPLPPADLEKVLKAAEEAIHLADCRKTVLSYLESRMDVIAPNVAAIIGSALAARLITHANGVTNLARMPSQNIMLIGSSSASMKSAASGGSVLGGAVTAASGSAATRSIIYGCDIIQMTPATVRNRALKLVAGKLGLAARVDSFHEAPSGEIGHMLREQILRSLIKAQEPPPAPLKKSLPVPDDAPKSRRGGKRYRRSKEKYGMSEFRKEANRLAFGPEAEEEIGQEGEGGFGMINKGFGHGKLRLQTKQLKVQVKRQRRQQRQIAGTRSLATQDSAASSGATGGMSSSLVFTPLQGIELCNPGALQVPSTIKEDKEYFSTAVTFVKTEDKK